ncbi:MAG: hypothetical protein AAGF12_07300 [Myxococcota bacterium]
MGKRLLTGLAKGLLIGALLGAGVQFGLGWITAGLLGYLFAMGVGASAGLLCGKPLWRSEAWLESVLKALAGVGVGALLYFLASYVPFGIFFAIGPAEAGTAWTSHPILFAPLIGGLFGAVVELDNSGAKKSSTKRSGDAPKIRAPEDLDDFFAEGSKKKNRKVQG